MRTAFWDEQVFFEQCKKDFAFLDDFGYKRPKIEKGSVVFKLTYRSKISAVEITFDRREQQVDVYLIRLVESIIPGRYHLINGKVAANHTEWFHLYDLLHLRAPELVTKLAHGGSRLSEADLQNIVAKYAQSLFIWGQDFLWGDLSVFTEMAKCR